MKKQVFTFIIALTLCNVTLAQNTQFDPALVTMGWVLLSPEILKRINDPLTKEIISKAIPKIINQDAKGATFEITDAIYRIKKIKVGNKAFLSQLEINVNEAIKSIRLNDIPNAVGSLAKTASYTEFYFKSGTLDKVATK